MKRYLPLMLIGAGVLLLITGFIYDVLLAGIPYQDPTPEMASRYAFHSQIASIAYKVGGGVVFIGALTGVMRIVIRRFSRP